MEEIIKYFTIYIDILQLTLLSVFAITLIIQLSYYLGFFRKFVVFKNTLSNSTLEPVSVVICAKNEEENLKNNLPLILEQDFPNFEVIVVNDGSYDETDIVLAQFKEKYENLIITTIPQDKKFSFGKKLALTVGIKAARNEIVVLTDADCIPSSNQWLREIQNGYDENTEIVLAYGKYKTKPGLLNKLIRFDTLFIAIQYFSYAIAKKPFMGVGRNLSYKKSIFFQNKGFASHLKLASGDDDLFINEIANKTNTNVVFSHNSHTISEPKDNYEDWSIQKKRHLTTGVYYKSSHKRLLFFENFSRIVFYLTFALLFSFKNLIGIISVIFIIRLTTQLIIIKKSMKLLNEKDLLLYSPLFDIILPILNLNFIIGNYFSRKKNKWN